MSGRAIILLVVGLIMMSDTILYRIEAASSAIVANSAGYAKKQNARNIAQSGVNLALRQLETNSAWRTGFSSLSMLSGTATVTLFDTSFAGIAHAIRIRSVATSQASTAAPAASAVRAPPTRIRSVATSQESTAVSTAICYFPQPMIPPIVKGLVTINGSDDINGSITLDAEDHKPWSTTVNPGKGTYAVWTTGSSFTLGSSSSKVGGTALGVDFVPTNPVNPAVVMTNQSIAGGYPGTPDSAFGGADMGYPEGTLKAVAQSGVAGSQYVTDPAKLKYPLSGVTHVEMPSGSNIWNSANINGSGMLIIHNSVKNSMFKGASGWFSGIILSDDISLLHAQIWGTIIGLTPNPAGAVMGNGSAVARYSRQSILDAVGMVSNGTGLKVIAWRE